MLIRYGYDLEFFCSGPVVMLTQLDAHPDVSHRITSIGEVVTTPAARRDHIHRRLRRQRGSPLPRTDRLHAHHPRLRVRVRRDPAGGRAVRARSPAGGTARRILHLSRRQPLLRSRSHVGDRLAAVRRNAVGMGARASHLRFRRAAHDVRLPVRTHHAHRLRGLRGAGRRMPRLRPSRSHAMSLHEHPGALRQRLHGQYRRDARAARRLQRLVRGLSRRLLVHLRRPPQHPAHRPHHRSPRAAMRRISHSPPRSARTISSASRCGPKRSRRSPSKQFACHPSQSFAMAPRSEASSIGIPACARDTGDDPRRAAHPSGNGAHLANRKRSRCKCANLSAPARFQPRPSRNAAGRYARARYRASAPPA